MQFSPHNSMLARYKMLEFVLLGKLAHETPSPGPHERRAWIRLISHGQEMQKQMVRTMNKRS